MVCNLYQEVGVDGLFVCCIMVKKEREKEGKKKRTKEGKMRRLITSKFVDHRT